MSAKPERACAPSEGAITPALLATTLRGTREGSSGALSQLFGWYSAHVFGVAFRITRSADEADDVLQDVFVRLPAGLRSFDGRSSFQHWLTSVTVRAALTHLRRQRARGEESFCETTHDTRATPQPLDRIALAEALNRLPPESRAVLLLRAEGYSHAEIGKLLSIRPGTSEVRLYRAREALRALLGGGS